MNFDDIAIRLDHRRSYALDVDETYEGPEGDMGLYPGDRIVVSGKLSGWTYREIEATPLLKVVDLVQQLPEAWMRTYWHAVWNGADTAPLIAERQRLIACARSKRDAEESRWLANAIEEAGIPLEYRTKTIERYVPRNPSQEKARRSVEIWPLPEDEGDTLDYLNLLLFGPVGTGKSHLAASACLNEIAMAGASARWRSSTALMREFRESRDQGKPFMFYGCGVDLLVVDDLGVDCDAFAKSTVIELLDLRVSNGLKTIFTTNCNLAELAELLGQRGVSRLRHRGAVLHVDGADYRVNPPRAG